MPAATAALSVERLGQYVRRHLAESLRARNLMPTHYRVLMALDLRPRATQRQLGLAAEVSHGDLVNLIDRLERDGLVNRTPNPQDRRQNRVELTEVGCDAVRDLEGLALEVDDQFLAPLDVDERIQLRRLLDKLLRSHVGRPPTAA
jgi:DNA-binding MarR family transcriptional regulator